MKIIDIVNPQRVNRKPDKTIVLMSSGDFSEHGFIVKKIELKLYLEKKDEKLGQYSLITSNVETDKGSVEMIYDEGFRGENALEKAADFLTKNLGPSGLITRSIITLQSNL
ncbi:MAG: hypothetical protein NPMRTH1_1730003 [Nitrosopumilales archaeon]|nr:MAG: hypothetical protein NPMRTH1_1730003 [Nitrosopumilales archaeon]